MDFDWILDSLRLIGALGFFIFGMKVMSEGIQKAAGSRLREILGAMTKNRYLGVLTGFLITALVQSSSATTVMTVSFVNAGLMSLVESAGVMMGANVGTTITAYLVSYFGFEIKVQAFALPIIALGFPLLFVKRGNIKFWGEFMIGFALLFLGLEALKSSVPDLNSNPEILAFLSEYSKMGIWSTLLFVLVGTILTIVVQSSSAAMTLTITMCHQGWIPFDVAAPMVLGENIGTTITAQLASIVGNVHAKRSARIHFFFNVFGVAWMVFAAPLYLKAIDAFMISNGQGSPFAEAESVPFALSYFHTAFNISNVLLLIWFVPMLVRLAKRTVKSRGEEDEKHTLEFLSSGTQLTQTTEISLLEARDQVHKFGTLTQKMHGFTKSLLTQKDNNENKSTVERITKYEEITDKIEIEIADYLLRLSEREMSEKSSLRVRSMLSIISELEGIGDTFFQMAKSFERKRKEKSWFTPEQRQSLSEMFDKVDEAFTIMVDNLSDGYDKADLEKAEQKQKEITRMRKLTRKSHINSIESGHYNIRSGLIYADIYNSLENVGRHILTVSEAIDGQA